MTTVSNEVIEKLQKILNLANGRGATEGEMQAAMARAREIAMKHGINLAEMPQRTDGGKSRVSQEVKEGNFRTSTRYEHPYHNWVLLTLQECFEVRFLITRTRIGSHPYITNILCLGEEADLALAMGLFPWLEELFPKLYGKALKEGKVLKNFAHANGFYWGLCEGIKANNKREEEKLSTEDRSKWALVVQDKRTAVDLAVEKRNPRKTKESRKRYSGHAYTQGQEAGSKINLNQVK